MTHLDKNTLEVLQDKLETELKELQTELEKVAYYDNTTHHWRAHENDPSDEEIDPNNVADEIEDLRNNQGIVKELEPRYREVKEALERLKEDTYGTCKVNGQPIEKERLMANPAATTCIEHKDVV